MIFALHSRSWGDDLQIEAPLDDVKRFLAAFDKAWTAERVDKCLAASSFDYEGLWLMPKWQGGIAEAERIAEAAKVCVTQLKKPIRIPARSA